MHGSSFASALIALAWPLACPLAAQAPPDSPMFRGNPSHAGVYAAPTHPIKGTIAWSFETLGWDRYQKLEDMDGDYMWPSTPAVVGDRIYAAAGPFLYVLDLKGQMIRQIKLSSCTLASPAVSNGVVYLPTKDGKLNALDAQDGRTIWTASIGNAGFLKMVDTWDVYQSSATVAEGRVFVGSGDGRIYAFSAQDGHELWHVQTRHAVRATPAVAGGRVFCGSFDGHVYALDAQTGKTIWDVDTKTPGVPWKAVQGSCAIENGLVYVGSRSAFFYGIDAATGAVRWKDSHDGSWVPSSPAVRDGIAYVGQSDDSKVCAVDAKGKRLWTRTVQDHTFASPALAGDVLFVATNNNYNYNGKGHLYALEPKTGNPIWTLELPGSVWSSPVVAGNLVLLGCSDGKLYAIQ